MTDDYFCILLEYESYFHFVLFGRITFVILVCDGVRVISSYVVCASVLSSCMSVCVYCSIRRQFDDRVTVLGLLLCFFCCLCLHSFTRRIFDSMCILCMRLYRIIVCFASHRCVCVFVLCDICMAQFWHLNTYRLSDQRNT